MYAAAAKECLTLYHIYAHEARTSNVENEELEERKSTVPIVSHIYNTWRDPTSAKKNIKCEKVNEKLLFPFGDTTDTRDWSS